VRSPSHANVAAATTWRKNSATSISGG